MPDRCCVPGCKSNYDNTGKYITVFKFPNDEEEKKLWCRKIPRKDWTPAARSVVCALHFEESDIIRYDEFKDSTGILQRVERRPALKTGAYPFIFPQCPKYLSEKKPTPRRSRCERQEEVDARLMNNFLQHDEIKNFEEFDQQIDQKVSGFNFLLNVIRKENAIFILNINFSSTPNIHSSIKVNRDMTIDSFLGRTCVQQSKFKNILNDVCMLKHWSELENLMTSLKNMEDNDANYVSPTSEDEKSILHWEKSISLNPESESTVKKKIILEQMKLCNKSKMARRYSNELLIFAYTLYMNSPSCYSLLYDSGLFTVPSKDHLFKITHILKLDNSLNCDVTREYIKQKCNNLAENDKLVNLLIDEIYVKKSIAYKGKSLTGFAENTTGTEATTVQAFMVNSIYSSYREVVALVPVNNMDAKYLHSLVVKALQILEDAGFTVVSVISDNNRINRNMFTMLGNTDQIKFVSNPVNTTKKLFLLFDSVHLLKSIRNNWINQLDVEKTFCCPDFEDPNDPAKCLKPKFSHLRKMYHWEKTSIVKMGHKLSFKSLYPSNIEKQNVKLALNVFHESNDAALQLLGERNFLPQWQDSVKFLQLIRKWWNIMNVSHLNKGHYLKCSDSNAFTKLDDERFQFLKQFSQWLHHWKNRKLKPRCGRLSEETFFALSQTTSTIIEVIQDLLLGGAKFVLTTKFQTDRLEYRFSEYRQMSGGNYHISVQQILESERKLKLKSILQLRSTMHGTISFKTFVTEISGNVEELYANIDLTPFSELISSDVNLTEISQCDAEVLTYIGGYCASIVKVNCSACKSFCITSKELLAETCDSSLSDEVYVYIDIINRGGLKYPTKSIILCISITYLLFQSISEKYEIFFIQYAGKQHELFTKITETYLKTHDICLINENCILCNCKLEIIIMNIVKSFVNICLNNYVKNISAKFNEQNTERKLKKFKK